MNKFSILVAFLLSMSFNTNTKLLPQDEISKTAEPYDIKLHLEKLKNNSYNIVIKMELEKNAHYVSPNSKGDYSGIFAMILDKNTKLHMSEKFSESPQSEETIDPWNGDPVNFVTEDTTHTTQFTITDTNDFEVSGHIQFTIEPRCTLEKIHFTISNTSGKLTIKRVHTKR